MTRSIAIAAALAAGLALAACGGGRDHYITEGSDVGRLNLSARGEQRVAPDMAFVTAGVVAEAQSAEAAMSEQRERMSGVLAALIEAGIAERDIQTTGLDLSPVYAPYERDTQERAIIGYRASNQVTAVARDLTRVGATLDALVEAGANTIHGVRFDVENSDELLDAARREAVQLVLERARLYAEAGGFSLGRILDMSENAGGPIPIEMNYARSAVADAGPTPVSAGEMELSVTVSATFEIERPR